MRRVYNIGFNVTDVIEQSAKAKMTTLRRFFWTAGIFVAIGVYDSPAAELPDPIASLQGRATADPRVRTYVLPSRIVWQSDEGVERAESLTVRSPNQITLAPQATCLLRTGEAPSGILIDFGKELSGGVQIGVKNLHIGEQTLANEPGRGKSVRLRVRFGESVSEAMSDIGDNGNATNDHAVRDQTCLVPWLGTQEIGNTGFRFVRIDLLDTHSDVEIAFVNAVFLHRELAYLGSFHSSDERLNQIWDVGAYTVHLNMQDYLWDGVKRDRLVWTGDMHPETMTILSVFGAHDIVPKSLDLNRDITPLPKFMNGISSYSMWWVLLQSEWYQYTGDKAYLAEQESYLTGLLELLAARYIGPDNRETLPEMRFLDWPSSGNDEAIHAGLQSLLTMTFDAGAELCTVLGNENTCQTCLTAAARLRKHQPDPNGSKQAAALMALAGLGDAGTLNREVMAVDGAQRLSTFYGYYVLEARAKAGDYQGGLDNIREFWGGMLDMGATTFWEDFNLDWTKNAAPIDALVPPGKKDIHGDFGAHCYIGLRHSLCHGWAGGPTAWLSEHVLGVKVLEPGCSVIRVDPHLEDIDWVEGTFPTPHGVLQIRHTKLADGTIESDIEAPTGVQIVR
ncbi:hypothetical protein OAS39_01335 [Pirellulales bacterium]|nr:hypothetical protein [Pirellulales bacterium]